MREQPIGMSRVEAVTERFDVSVHTTCRATDSGDLRTLRIGTGKGTSGSPESTLATYEDPCEQATHEMYMTGDASAVEEDIPGEVI
ncbi:hypothetical protein J2S53_002822 [Actinopolyspora lacussalsi]|nr:hypothetical protein [Actinopolyspora lacussalsi]